MSSRLGTQSLWFLLFWIVSLAVFLEPLVAVVSLSARDERYTHIALMPFISLALIFLDRRRIFIPGEPPSVRVGLLVTALGAALYAAVQWAPFSPAADNRLSLEVLSLVLIWSAGFVLFYGRRAAQAAMFPLSLLLLTIPLPASVVEVAQSGLQLASAEVTHLIFGLTGTPCFREGLLFSLPGVTIEVAQECSGIRSSIALLITALVLSHLFLRSAWRKAWFILLTVPITIFKNAVRITTLSWLGVYASKDFLFGDLHHRGGPVFSLISLALLVPLLLVLQRSEAGQKRQVGASSSVSAE